MIMKKEIRAVGFDLDNTLYVATPEINEVIRGYACRRAAQILSRQYDSLRAEFEVQLAETNSGSKSLERLGLENGKLIMQEAIEKADISSVLMQDYQLVEMLSKLKKTLPLFLITSSGERAGISKLKAVGLDPQVFELKIFGDSPYNRKDGSTFRYVSEQLIVEYNRMLFVGDRENTDILPAKSLGIKTAIVNAKSEHADYNLKTIYDLDSILSK